MFCWKCGKEIPQESKFCPACGTPIGGEGKAGPSGNQAIEKARQLVADAGNFKKGMEMIEYCKVAFFGAVAGLILCLFFLGSELIEASYEVFSSTYAEQFTLFKENSAWKHVLTLAYILAAVLLVFPIVRGKDWEEWHVYAAVAVPVLTVAVLLFEMAFAKGRINDDWVSSVVEIKVSLSSSGWFFLLINAATVMMAIKAASGLARYQERQYEEQYQAKLREEEKKMQAGPAREEKIPAWQRVEMEAKAISAGEDTITCPKCGRAQRSNRKCCFICGVQFETDQ